MRSSFFTLLACAVVGTAAIFIGQIPWGGRTVGALVVLRTRLLAGWVGRETSKSNDRMRRSVPAEGLLGSETKVEPSSDDDLVTESDRRSLMRLLE